MPVFVINLDRRPDRLAALDEAFSRIGLSYEKISAVDAARDPLSGEISAAKAFIYNRLKRPPTSQAAVALSHRKIWQRMVDDNIQSALVFEDDAVPVDWDPDVLSVDIADAGLDLLRLEAVQFTRPNWPKPYLRRAGQPLLGRVLSNQNTFGTAALVITQRGARTCLDAGKYWFQVDHYNIWERVYGLRTALLLPVMFEQSGSPSDAMAAEEMPAGGACSRRSVGRCAREYFAEALRFGMLAALISFSKILRRT